MTSFRGLLVALFLLSVSQVHSALHPVHPKEAIRNAFYKFFQQNLPKVRETGKGVVKSCGPPDANFTIEWEPEVIDPEGKIVVYYNYTVPHDFKQGTVDVTLYFNNIPNPIFEDSFPVNCDKIRKYLPCPMKAGLKLQGKYANSNLLILKGYDGTYKGHVNLRNGDNQVVFCANATLTIKGSG